MRDNRRHERIDFTVDVEVEIPGCGKQVLKTSNLSDGGLLLASAGCSPLPAVGTQLTIRVISGGGDMPRVPARVVRVDEEGIAVEFLA
jgi:hypothetical protein